MGQEFGQGLCGILAKDLDESDRIEFLTEFGQRSRLSCFREIIGDRVLEVETRRRKTRTRWLDPWESQPIVSEAHEARGSAPYSFFDAIEPTANILVTGYRGPKNLLLESVGEISIGSLPKQIIRVRRILSRARREPDADELVVEFYKSYLADLEIARKHLLIFMT